MEKSQNTESNYDVIIVGGGIQGAGVAQAVQAAGYNSMILEKSYWAAGTSSKSSKLIHGGLRYLQTGNFSLIKESLRERRLLLKNGPDLVYPNGFYIPVYKHSQYRPWKIRLALIAYWFLSGCCPDGLFKVISKKHWHQLKGLNIDGLIKVFRYQDAQTDDTKLTEAVISSAVAMGAATSCPSKLLNAQQITSGYRIEFEESGPEHESIITTATCRILINAGGPWINQIAECISPRPNTIPISLVQGAHLVLDTKISEECFYLESPTDGRPVFVLPWHDGTLLGTTETLFEGNPEDCAITDQEKEYLMDVLNTYFPDYQGKVCGDMAGLRVLPKHEDTQAHHQLSREVQLITDCNSQPHYLGIYGGKLTGYRATAAKVVKIIEGTLHTRKPRGNTRCIPLTKNIQ
ncbi:MAG: FAD-dependent oxidoreductase [Porticoccus sp.]|nr:FAD-dependent oxidoreductase [Porticoccus sp.]